MFNQQNSRVVIDYEAKPITARDLCLAYFGMSVDALANDIAVHPERYQHILADKPKRKEPTT